MKLGIRQAIVSASVFVGLLLVLAFWDGRVRQQVGDVLHGDAQMSSLGSRAAELGGVIISAIRYQSIDNGPMVVFAAVGAVLVLFMLRT
jgi:hypothetical protein